MDTMDTEGAGSQSTVGRLARVERKVDGVEHKLDGILTDLARLQSAIERVPDEARLRRLEDQQLVWDTRWSTIGTMLTRVFGMSIVAAVASIISIMLVLLELGKAVIT
ncbi:MAG TPA: hypothetical protein VLM76_11845 [Patescibacteria group bacterium]|nr:hypothetical protein [Patescibacteria group bacterium]